MVGILRNTHIFEFGGKTNSTRMKQLGVYPLQLEGLNLK